MLRNKGLRFYFSVPSLVSFFEPSFFTLFFVGFLQCTKSCSFYVNCSAFLRQLNEMLWTGNERGKMGKFTRPLSKGYRIIVMSFSNEKVSQCCIFRWSCFMHEQCCLRSWWNEFEWIPLIIFLKNQNFREHFATIMWNFRWLFSISCRSLWVRIAFLVNGRSVIVF